MRLRSDGGDGTGARTPLVVMQLVLSLDIGGMEKLVYDMVQRFDQRQVTSVVCCLDSCGSFGEALRSKGYRVRTLGRRAGFDRTLVARLTRAIREEHVDVLHAQQYTPLFYGVLAAMRRRLMGLSRSPRIVYTCHGLPFPFRRVLRRRMTNAVLSRASDAVLTISMDTKANLAKYEGIPADRIEVLYNGIDDRRCLSGRRTTKASLGLPADAPVIGVVARLDPVKNHAALLRAFNEVRLHQPGAYLVIVGDGPERETLIKLAQSIDEDGHIRFLGARTDAADLFHAFDVAVLPSLSEGMSVTLLEAMAAGRPVVATAVGGNTEVVEDGVTGILTPPEDEAAMASSLVALLEDAALRRRMGEAGLRRVRERFSLDKMVESYSALYERVVVTAP